MIYLFVGTDGQMQSEVADFNDVWLAWVKQHKLRVFTFTHLGFQELDKNFKWQPVKDLPSKASI